LTQGVISTKIVKVAPKLPSITHSQELANGRDIIEIMGNAALEISNSKWRPLCQACLKSVESVVYELGGPLEIVTMTVQCHGNTQVESLIVRDWNGIPTFHLQMALRFFEKDAEIQAKIRAEELRRSAPPPTPPTPMEIVADSISAEEGVDTIVPGGCYEHSNSYTLILKAGGGYDRVSCCMECVARALKHLKRGKS
jgi:hypothetical protein